LQEAEPLGGSGTEDAAAVEGHAGRAREVMSLDAIALDGLLGEGVAGCEEDGGGDGLCEERARGQLGLVPVYRCRLVQCCRHVNDRSVDVPAKHFWCSG
jgi:hypothetical protein